MPHTWDIVGQLFEPSRRNGPLLIEVLWDSALFTAKEAVVGFALGATGGFLIAVVLVHWTFLRRGLLPYIVASQTIPILAIAPMVVIWLGGRGLPTWFPVSVIAAYLTFFPVTINAIRGLESADPRALELMDSYAAGRLGRALEAARPRVAPVPLRRLQDLARPPASSAPSSVSCPRRSRTASAAPSSTSTSTTPPRPRASGRRTSIAAALGISFFLVIVGRREAGRPHPRRSGSYERARPSGLAPRRHASSSARRRRSRSRASTSRWRPGEFISLIGPSGCGKSTLLRIVGDLTDPTAGEVVVNGKPARQARIDRDYGIVFQDAVLYDWRTVAKNIALPLEMLGWDRKRRAERVDEMLALVELTGFEGHHPWQLSGGMQQRVAIARRSPSTRRCC